MDDRYQQSQTLKSNSRKTIIFRHSIRFLLSFSFFTTLLLLPRGSSYDSAGVRGAQVDKGVASYAYRAGAMMIQKDKITSISQVYGALMFDGNKWNSVTDITKFPRSDLMGDMFLDSRGIIYVGGVRADYNGSNTPYSYIFESSDGLNFSPVQQFVDATGEASYGNSLRISTEMFGRVSIQRILPQQALIYGKGNQMGFGQT